MWWKTYLIDSWSMKWGEVMTKPIGYWWTGHDELAEVLKIHTGHKSDILLGFVYPGPKFWRSAAWNMDGSLCSPLVEPHEALVHYLGPTHPGVYVRPEVEPKLKVEYGWWRTASGACAEIRNYAIGARWPFSGRVFDEELKYLASALWDHEGECFQGPESTLRLVEFLGEKCPRITPKPKYRPWTKDEIVVQAIRNRLIRHKEDGDIGRICASSDPDVLLEDWELVQYGHSSGGVHHIKLLPCGELADTPPMTIEWRRG